MAQDMLTRCWHTLCLPHALRTHPSRLMRDRMRDERAARADRPGEMGELVGLPIRLCSDHVEPHQEHSSDDQPHRDIHDDLPSYRNT